MPELGGESSFLKPIWETSYYLPMNKKAYMRGMKMTPRNHYLAFHVEGGLIEPLSDDEVPIFERYSLGGERSLRIFESRTVGPTIENLETGERLVFGGDTYYMFNAEYAVPINNVLEVALFADAGNTWGTDDFDPLRFIGHRDGDQIQIWEDDPFSMRVSTGIELRFFTPVFQFPLRLIWGINLDPRPWEDSTDFLFSIGKTFN